jgi:hypothetical protein
MQGSTHGLYGGHYGNASRTSKRLPAGYPGERTRWREGCKFGRRAHRAGDTIATDGFYCLFPDKEAKRTEHGSQLVPDRRTLPGSIRRHSS